MVLALRSECLTLNGLRLIVLLKHFDSELADKSAVNIIRVDLSVIRHSFYSQGDPATHNYFFHCLQL